MLAILHSLGLNATRQSNRLQMNIPNCISRQHLNIIALRYLLVITEVRYLWFRTLQSWIIGRGPPCNRTKKRTLALQQRSFFGVEEMSVNPLQESATSQIVHSDRLCWSRSQGLRQQKFVKRKSIPLNRCANLSAAAKVDRYRVINMPKSEF